jgi:hypothetical protein
LFAVPSALAQPSVQNSANADLIKNGEYLARAGDCFSCHTQAGGIPMAGGRQVPTPYGGISSPNIARSQHLHRKMERNRFLPPSA